MNERVMLFELSERTSAKGNTYMSGWLGKASVVGFKAKEPDKHGNDVWQIFVAEPRDKPAPRPERTHQHPEHRSGQRNHAAAVEAQRPDYTRQSPVPVDYDDSLEDVGR